MVMSILAIRHLGYSAVHKKSLRVPVDSAFGCNPLLQPSALSGTKSTHGSSTFIERQRLPNDFTKILGFLPQVRSFLARLLRLPLQRLTNYKADERNHHQRRHDQMGQVQPDLIGDATQQCRTTSHTPGITIARHARGSDQGPVELGL
jgi:hypothetical protein